MKVASIVNDGYNKEAEIVRGDFHRKHCALIRKILDLVNNDNIKNNFKNCVFKVKTF